jgi:uncharacterized protein YecT (DUF1311 family)
MTDLPTPSFAVPGYPLLLLVLLAVQIAPALAVDCNVNPTRWLNETCLQQAVDGTSADIERAVASLVAVADDTRRPLLAQAQQAWLGYRKEQCRLEFDTTRIMHDRNLRHGTAAPVLERACQLRLNDGRLLELRALVKRPAP